MDAYREDLAYIHDVGFTGFANGISPGLLDILAKHGLSSGRVNDLGCGGGVWARDLVDAGYEVHGIDISPAMIDIAKARVPEASFAVGSFLDVDLPTCCAVTSLGECFNYLFDEKNGRDPLRALFGRIFEALDSGGILIFDVAEPGRGGGVVTRAWEKDDWAMFTEYEEDTRNERFHRRIVTYRKLGELYRREEEIHRLQLYRAETLFEDLERAGFEAEIVRGYGDYAFPDCYAGFVAKKP